MDTTHMLMQFGLTHQEAQAYICLSGSGQATGYELAKLSGISRSNAYACLASLVEKGAAWVVDGKPVRYQAVPVGEFCGSAIRSLSATQARLEEALTPREDGQAAYLTVKGGQNIRRKVEALIASTERHIYLSMRADTLDGFAPQLARLAEQGKKVVVITDRAVAPDGATFYCNPDQSEAIRVISDTAAALTGSLDDTQDCSCLYSRKQNLVDLLRDSMKNEIRLIQLRDTPGCDPKRKEETTV